MVSDILEIRVNGFNFNEIRHYPYEVQWTTSVSNNFQEKKSLTVSSISF